MKKTTSKSSTKVCSAKFCAHKGKPQPVANFTQAEKYADHLYVWCKECSAKYTSDRKLRMVAVAEGKTFTSKLTGRKYEANGKAEVKVVKPAKKTSAVKKAIAKSGVKVIKSAPKGLVAQAVEAVTVNP